MYMWPCHYFMPIFLSEHSIYWGGEPRKKITRLEKENKDLREGNKHLKRVLLDAENYQGKQVIFVFRNSPKRNNSVCFKAIINLDATRVLHMVYFITMEEWTVWNVKMNKANHASFATTDINVQCSFIETQYKTFQHTDYWAPLLEITMSCRLRDSETTVGAFRVVFRKLMI